jgi:hypothetical protein
MKTIDVDAVTGEETLRDMTPAEIANIDKIAANNKAKEQAATIKETAKSALLAKLGITADEAALLLG